MLHAQEQAKSHHTPTAMVRFKQIAVGRYPKGNRHTSHDFGGLRTIWLLDHWVVGLLDSCIIGLLDYWAGRLLCFWMFGLVG